MNNKSPFSQNYIEVDEYTTIPVCESFHLTKEDKEIALVFIFKLFDNKLFNDNRNSIIISYSIHEEGNKYEYLGLDYTNSANKNRPDVMEFNRQLKKMNFDVEKINEIAFKKLYIRLLKTKEIHQTFNENKLTENEMVKLLQQKYFTAFISK